MEEADLRTPGRVVTVHEKLSSPSRKRFLLLLLLLLLFLLMLLLLLDIQYNIVH